MTGKFCYPCQSYDCHHASPLFHVQWEQKKMQEQIAEERKRMDSMRRDMMQSQQISYEELIYGCGTITGTTNPISISSNQPTRPYFTNTKKKKLLLLRRVQ